MSAPTGATPRADATTTSLRPGLGVRRVGDHGAGVDLQGQQDRMVPFPHARWLAARIPGARLHLYADQRHLWFFPRMARIIDDLETLPPNRPLGQRPSRDRTADPDQARVTLRSLTNLAAREGT